MNLRKKRKCSMCRTFKRQSAFYRTGEGRHRGQCKLCVEDQRRWVNYGVLPWDYWNAFYCSSGKCAICGKRPMYGEALSVDHDHKTKAVRGLLCKPCNLAIGLLKDKVDNCLYAAVYLEVSQ